MVRPELVRSIYACQALDFVGSAFRGGSVRKLVRLHQKSKATKRIDEFWSHSWQKRPYQKVLCLLFLKNGVAASLTGTLAASMVCIFMRYGFLLVRLSDDINRRGEHLGMLFLCTASGLATVSFPTLMALVKPPRPQHASKSQPWVPEVVRDDCVTVSRRLWLSRVDGFRNAAQVTGTLVAVLTLFMWRSSTKVFLDVCCIDQVNVKNKQEGILSLGGILNSCKTLLILWDETYIERLWCVSLGCLSRLHRFHLSFTRDPTILEGLSQMPVFMFLRASESHESEIQV